VVVGVLALQGDFEAHAGVLTRLGAEARIVRTPADLAGLDGLVIPGGESTTMTIGIEQVLAVVDGHPVAVRQGDVTAVAFHPELTGDARLHRRLVDAVAARQIKEPA